MSTSPPYVANVTLGQLIFGQAELGDKRRTNRLVETFDQLRRHPGGTLPAKLPNPADLRAFYRLCHDDDVTHAALLDAARQYTLQQIAAVAGPVLVIHDATELDYSTLSSLAEDLGQIGKGDRRGYVCQNVLAVAAETGEVLGLLDQILHHRDTVPKHEPLPERRARATRESLLWLQGTQYLPADKQLIDVADQGADTFEFLEHERHSGRRFVVRVCKPRKVHAGHRAIGKKQSLKEAVDRFPEQGRVTMDVQPQRDRPARRQTEFVVRGGAVLVDPPHAKYGLHGDDPLPLYAVQITEIAPPPGEDPIAWLLLTNEAVNTFDDALRVIGWYERRWIIEEYHKAQKTGCQIEDLQFTTIDRLEPAIALLSVLAATLLNLRDLSRRADAKTRLAKTLVAHDYVEVLSLWRHGIVRAEWTVVEFCWALARLGGHQNRRSDSPPGWLVLWRGWIKLHAMLDGYDAARQRKWGIT